MISLNRSLKKILIFVISTHVLIIASGLIHIKTTHHPKPVKKIFVQHVPLKPNPQPVIAQAKPMQAQPAKKAPVKKVPEKKKEEPPKPIVDTKKQQLLAKAQEKMANLQKNKTSAPQTKKTTTTLPQLKVDQIAVDIGDDLKVTYHDTLAEFLKNHLVLPDIGDVKIKLTLSRIGKIVEFKILRSENERNKTYIQENLPKLKFPSFDEHLKGENVYTFVMTLIN